MQSRRHAVQQIWNRFIAAVLFVLGAALSTAALPEPQETRMSRADRTQLDATHSGHRLCFVRDAPRDCANNDSRRGSLYVTLLAFDPAPSENGRPFAVSRRPAPPARSGVRNGDSRAPPSA
jgi:hypothetical protein